MAENEVAANALVAQLRKIGIDARVAGAGVHWHVDVGPVASRTLRVHCFWYERVISGLMLGMNPANSRSTLSNTRQPYEGPEYLVVLQDGGRRVADGRSRKESEVVACARAWLATFELADLVREVPFVDRKPRAMRAVAERLDPRLRWEILEEPGCELWVYSDDRGATQPSGFAKSTRYIEPLCPALGAPNRAVQTDFVRIVRLSSEGTTIASSPTRTLA